MHEFDSAIRCAERNGASSCSYSSDQTPITLKQNQCYALNGRTFKRRGKDTCELLVERVFFRGTDSCGNVSHAVKFADPRPSKKTGWSLLANVKHTIPDLRFRSFTGIVIYFFNFDRGRYESLQKHCRRFVASFTTSNTLEALCTWTLTTGDCLHDSMNGFNWSIREWEVGDVTKRPFFRYSIHAEHLWLLHQAHFGMAWDAWRCSGGCSARLPTGW